MCVTLVNQQGYFGQLTAESNRVTRERPFWVVPMDGVGRGFLLTGGFGLLYLDNEISFDFNFLITEF